MCGRCECIGAPLQLRRSARTLQHARYAQGAAHGVPDERVVSATRTWAASCVRSPTTPAVGMTRCAALSSPQHVADEVRRVRSLPGASQRLVSSNGYDSLLNELGKYGLGKRDLSSASISSARSRSMTTARLQYHRGHSAPALRRPAFRNECAGGPGDLPASARSGADLSAARHSPDDLAFASGAAQRSLPHALSRERTRFQKHRSVV